MTTTAHEDQFTDAPEPVIQPYDTGSILRRNVADLEIALKQHAERAEAAEAELLAVREDNHSMMLEIDGLRKELVKLREQKPALYMSFSDCGNFIRYWTRDTKNLEATMAVNDFEVFEFYAAAVPAPAVPAAPEHCKDCGMRWTDTTAHANMCVAEMLRQDTKQALAVPMQRNLPGDRCEVCGAAGSADGASSTHCAPKPEFVFGRVVDGNCLSTKSVTVTIGGGASGAGGAGCAGGAGGAGVGAGTGSTAVFSGAALVSGTDNAANGTGKPAVAVPAVPEFCAVEAQLTLAETEMLNAKAWSAGTQAKRHIDFAMTAICCARDLLQSRAVKDSLTTQADCRACVNRGRVNGLSQETYCESCVHEGRNWRKNHFLDAAADRLLEGRE